MSSREKELEQENNILTTSLTPVYLGNTPPRRPTNAQDMIRRNDVIRSLHE